VALFRASFSPLSDEYLLIVTSHSGRKQRHLGDIRGVSQRERDKCYPVLTTVLSIPLRKMSRIYNTLRSSLSLVPVVNPFSFYFMNVNTPKGIRGLEFYDPVAKKHGQAYMQARLGIAQWLVKEGIARIEEIHAEDGILENLYIRVSLFEFECI